MKFNIKYLGITHARIKAPFYLTASIRDYFKKEAEKCPFIEKISFYLDEFTFSIYFHEREANVGDIQSFLLKIKKEEIKKLALLEDNKEETAYSIISNAITKRIFYKIFIPFPLRYLNTLYNSYHYIKSALKEKRLSMEVLDSSAILISLFINKSQTASNIMFMLNLGNKLDCWSLKKSIKDLEEGLKEKEYQVFVLENGKKYLRKTSEINVGDIIQVSEGSEILYDGIVYDGSGMVNESSLTGESFPIEKIKGSEIYSNTILQSGEIYLKVTNNKLNSRIFRLVELMKQGERIKDSKQRSFISLADKVVKYNFLGAGLTYLLTRSFNKAISFLLVDFSCAIKIATPVAYLSAVKKALDKKIMIKSVDVFDIYKDIDTYLFDKTGTITVSTPKVKKVLTFNGFTYETVVRISACLEEHIHHPIANAVVTKASEEGIIHEEMHDKLNYIASKGIKSTIDSEMVVIGNYKLMKEENIEITEEQEKIIKENKEKTNLLFLGYKQSLAAIFLIDTPLRREAKEVIEKLKEQGKEVILATGDTYERTQNVLKGLKFSKVYTNLKPKNKYEIILKLKKEGKKVLMIGDGLNDSAAISLANIGIVMNDSADISKQMSDVVLLNNNLKSLLIMEQVSYKLENLIKKNIKETVAVNSSLICLGLFNIVNPTLLSIFHNLTTLKIVVRSLKIN